MARIKYYYDVETCQFERQRLNWKTITRQVLHYGAISGFVAAALLAGVFFFYNSPKEKYLSEQNAKLKKNILTYDEQIARLETSLNDLHQKDNEFYRAIMNLPEVSSGMWNGGTGGSANTSIHVNDEEMEKTQQQLHQMEIKQKIQSQSFVNLFEKLKAKELELAHIPSIRPVTGALVSGFGLRMHPILKIKKLHTGLDFACPEGTPIYASGDGVVSFAGRHQNGYGIHVDINHGYGYVTKYGHMSQLKVSQGQKVKRGDIIGYSGNTGLSKGPHLHYEIIKNGRKINPVDYFYSDLQPSDYVEFKKRAEQAGESMD
ncbi:MAG: peptidoglycan DD-metalloendopeptidase family protein [Bacteroidia bacterium]|nr:peptidoglycan DD-metalloendopeptidase family protein [Bacteroidia bacterium]